MAAGGGVRAHAKFLEETGYSGYEMTPMNNRLSAELRLGLGKQALKEGVIASLHQSWRIGSMRERLQRPHSVAEAKKIARSVGGAALFPQLEASLPRLQQLQKLAGRKLNVVVYPNHQLPPNEAPRTIDYRKWKEEGGFSGISWQPTAEVLYRWGVLSQNAGTAMRGMQERMKDDGLDGVCFDTFHWPSVRYGRDDLVMPAWEGALPGLVKNGICTEMHIGPARPDMLGGDTKQLDLILQDKIAKTEIGDMLGCVAENLPGPAEDSEPFTFVTELPHMALGPADTGEQNYVAVHRDLAAAVRGVMEAGGVIFEEGVYLH